MSASTIELKRSDQGFWPLLAWLVPSLRIRFAVALLLTFFPFGILYPLEWPLRELITLFCWLCVFPSLAGLLCLALVPLLRIGTYDYWAFNLLCFTATLGVASSAAQREVLKEDIAVGLHEFARVCVLMTFVIGFCQVFSKPEEWTLVFKEMSLGDGGRGAGLLAEPSLLAGPLALYLALLVWRMGPPALGRETRSGRNHLLLEALLVIVCAMVITRSLSVLAVAVCFGPLVLPIARKPLIAVVGLLSGVLAATLAFGERIGQALEDIGGSAINLVSLGVGSWRNIPDFLIMINYRDFLLPGHPAEIRDKINAAAASWSLGLAWIENTYSTFSAGASTLGLVAMAFLFVTGAVIGVRRFSHGPLRAVWIMLYLADWFITPKFDAAGWVALGLLTLVGPPSGEYPWTKKKRSEP